MKCEIVDDEPLAREGIAGYVKDMDFLQLVDTCINPVELTKVLDANDIDLIFLDIQMPKMNGIEFLKITKNPPMVIITTAFSNYALESFQFDVIDYLLKPVTFERFYKAVHKAKDYHRLLNTSNIPQIYSPETREDYFFIKCGSKFEKIYLADILYIEGMQNYVNICTTLGKFTTLMYLKNLEEKLNEQDFIRVHKSYIVSINKIKSIVGNEILLNENRIPISRNYREQVLDKVVNDKLWQKKTN